jgi:hypothetical protein
MSGIEPIKSAQIVLSPLPNTVLPAIAEFINALGIPREVLASDEEIQYVWANLPRQLKDIANINLRAELIAKMCVAVSVGLFDSAINYAWNAAILHLREKIKNFGLPFVGKILDQKFEEKDLSDLQDSRLLSLCLELNLITEEGYFLLDQSRNLRNNFSAAHPTIGQLNDTEFINFLNRCVRYALAESSSPRGVNIAIFISTVKGNRFTKEQCSSWLESLDATHDAQRELLFGTLHGIYCDPESLESARLNIVDLSISCKDKFNSNIQSNFINQHSEYSFKGDTQRYAISQKFFEKIGLLNLLSNNERHTLISKAVKELWNVHLEFNNFRNEPPFARRLLDLSIQAALPETVQEEFVETVIGCYMGNGYGVSREAETFYELMIKQFTPREIIFLIGITRKISIIGNRFRGDSGCRQRFKKALNFIDISSVPETVQVQYNILK